MAGVALGLLVIRLALGIMLAVHGLNKVFGPGGLAGTARWFEGLGLRPGWLHARLAASNEIAAGFLMACGLAFPLAGAAFIGLMTVAALTDHRGKGFFVFKGGWEYVALIGVVAAALVSTGPGRYSLDSAIGWHLRGPGWAGLAIVVGLVAAVGMLLTATSGFGRKKMRAAGGPAPVAEATAVDGKPYSASELRRVGWMRLPFVMTPQNHENRRCLGVGAGGHHRPPAASPCER